MLPAFVSLMVGVEGARGSGAIREPKEGRPFARLTGEDDDVNFSGALRAPKDELISA